MARSLKKGPYIDPKLQKKVDNLSSSDKKQVIKTWSRKTTISPSFCGINICGSQWAQIHTCVCFRKYGRT